MYVLCVTAYIKPENIKDFLVATCECASQTRQEKGNVRYDVLQSEDDPACFVMYEAYQTKEAFLIYRDTLHSLNWKAKVESGWLALAKEYVVTVRFSEMVNL